MPLIEVFTNAPPPQYDTRVEDQGPSTNKVLHLGIQPAPRRPTAANGSSLLRLSATAGRLSPALMIHPES
jgi:hypothetical protein